MIRTVLGPWATLPNGCAKILGDTDTPSTCSATYWFILVSSGKLTCKWNPVTIHELQTRLIHLATIEQTTESTIYQLSPLPSTNHGSQVEAYIYTNVNIITLTAHKTNTDQHMPTDQAFNPKNTNHSPSGN
jgi:hypothetical protein